MPELSIVIPAYNEAKRIAKTLRAVRLYLNEKRLTHEIIVVDDGSDDATTQVVRQTDRSVRVIRNKKNHGKGDAVRTGMLATTGKYSLMMDADHSIKIDQLEKLWPHRKRFDIIIGSRFLNESRVFTQNWSRILISKFGNTLFRLLFGIRIRDTQCGFKLFSNQAARKIFRQTTVTGFAFDMEVLALAKRLGFAIKEVPIRWQDAPGGSIRAAAASWATLRELIRFYLRFNAR